MKKITVDSCENCMHRGHKGGFGNPGYVPKCDKVSKELPYTVGSSGKQVIAKVKPGIPKWCPLENDNPFEGVDYADLELRLASLSSEDRKKFLLGEWNTDDQE